MADLSLLTSFVRAAEHGSFSAAARSLGLTAAAVSKNVARLESLVGVRLFHRSTRRLALSEGGERFLAQVQDPLAALDAALAGIHEHDDVAAGTLKVSMGQALGRNFLVPLLGEFLGRFPAVVPDWHFDNRRIDLVGEGFDAAVGGGFALTPGLVARELAPVHIVAVAAPSYLAGRAVPQQPADFAALDGIMRRSSPTGRVRPWTLRTRRGVDQAVPCKPRLIFSDPEAIAHAGDGALQRRQRIAHLLQEALAALGEREAPGAAVEQPHAERGFEPRDVLADARRRQPQAARRRGEAAVFRGAREGRQVREFGHARS